MIYQSTGQDDRIESSVHKASAAADARYAANGAAGSSGHASLTKPPGGYRATDTERRLRWLRKSTGRSLDGLLVPETEDLDGIIEQHVGFVPVPQAVAAPLVISGMYAQGEFAVPLCTLEGTLVLSMTRGMLAFAMGGGCRAIHVRQELTRVPGFFMDSITQSCGFMEWVRSHFRTLKRVAESTTQHGRLLRIEAHPIQAWVLLEFVYDTGNAAGQNMVTLATEAACRYIREKKGFDYLLESGLNGDKKPSRRNMDRGRGHSVIVEIDLPRHVLEHVGVTATQLTRFRDLASHTTQAAGTLGTNLHVANALTAIYLATGQDVACVAENAVASSHVEESGDGGVICRLTLPSLTVGTVGGGTRLPAQRRNLELLGCDEGQFAARKLAEIIAGSAAALEFSLLAAIVSGTFAQAHQKYGRRQRKAVHPVAAGGNGNAGNGEGKNGSSPLR